MAEYARLLFATVYPAALERAGGERCDSCFQLMRYYFDNPDALPSPPPQAGGVGGDRTELVRAVADHVAGMTDRYAQRLHLELFMPKCWGDL